MRFPIFLGFMLGLILGWFASAAPAWAGGPRWVTGVPYFTTEGVPVVWYTNQPLYFTDPGDLSSSVNHAAADAMVAAAAAVWNVPTANLVLAKGGALEEHVSGANAFAGANGPIFPADVQSGNYLAKQIAVIYDSDGSVTDLLLGDGASDPSGCLQSGVTESVDSIVPAGFIQHAIIIINGRCSGPAPQQQLQYQLMRAFGRVLGLGWSQTNDNVFTDSPQPTANQALHWPVMHPIDILCSTYTYQCMPQPFTLRPDDLSALAQLYFIDQGQAGPGQMDSLLNASRFLGHVQFATGQGMEGVNVLVRRWEQFTAPSQIEDWYTASSVSGFLFRQSNGDPITGPDLSFGGSQGAVDGGLEGYFNIQRIPMLPGSWQILVVETEAVNPLYTGEYAVGPYVANTVDPSGSDPVLEEGLYSSYTQSGVDFSPLNSAAVCDTDADGTEASPVAVAAQGWWSSLLCGYGHSAWSSLSVKANRSLTVEVTAEDEQGFATTAKAMPVIGLWNATDALGSLPGVSGVGEAFNGEGTGMTTLSSSFTQPDQLRIGIADERGDGRPDYNYQARVLYADSLSPAIVSAAGGTVTITGMGFRTGNEVTVNGVAATVLSWTANTIVATVPSISALDSSTGLVADVEVTDLSTGGTTVMTQALSYSTPVPILSLVSAPSGLVLVGQAAAVPFAVKVMSGDGVTPVVGEAVTFTAIAGAVQFSSCGGASCTLSTDGNGIASTLVTALSAGAITLQAMGVDGAAGASFNAVVRVQTAAAVQATEYVAAGAVVAWSPQLSVVDNFASTTGLMVGWQAGSGLVSVSPSNTQVNSQGVAETSATVGPLAAGVQALVSGCAWTNTCSTFTTIGVDLADLRIVAVNGAIQTVAANGSLTPVALQVTDTAGHPVAGALVEIYQAVDAWQAACPDRGRCPIAPILEASQSSAVSDANGLLTVVPQQISGSAETTDVAVATGTQGFLSFSLQKQP
ncbi:IPT/TIG domain-containing protein [Granulicella sp. S190]|uniref:IPT/TIG domain-containing protein n=1 Tax=Granulicella sp. S190 TaxID=1747226 RepID=UPI001C20A382|nr:IPT/TIG domain-containing protein [Granulicella sp. S190]